MNEKSDLKLIAIRGLPGSGKSEFAKYLGLNFFEADQYFENFNDGIFDFKLIKKAHQFCYKNIEKELILGNSVVVSNTMTTENEVKEYQDLAAKYKARFVSLVLENRHKGKSIHDVPKSSIEQMRNRFSIRLSILKFI